MKSESFPSMAKRKSKRWIILSATVLILIAATVLAVWKTPKAGMPVAALPGGGDFNYGILDEGSAISHVFRVKNDGDGVLELKKLSKNCACIDARISRNRLGHGEEADINIGYRAANGSMTAAVMVETNDPSRRWLQFTIAGTVRRLLQCYPGALTFWSTNTQPQEIHLVVSQPVETWSVECSKKWMSARIEKDKDGTACVVTLNPDCPGGNWTEDVLVTAHTGTSTEKLRIPVLLRNVQFANSGS